MAEENKQSGCVTIFWVLLLIGFIIMGFKACTGQDTTSNDKEEDNAPFLLTVDDLDGALSAQFVEVSNDGITFDINYDGNTGADAAGRFYQISLKNIIVNGKTYTPINIEDGSLHVTVDGKSNDLGIIEIETPGSQTTHEKVEANKDENVTARITISTDNCTTADDYQSMVLKFNGCSYWYKASGATTPLDYGEQQLTFKRR